MTTHYGADGVQPPSTTPTAATLRPITTPHDARPAAHPAADPYARVPRSPWPAKRCPACGAALDGGPTRYRCEPCGHGWTAADLDTEYHPNHRTAGHDYGRAAA